MATTTTETKKKGLNCAQKCKENGAGVAASVLQVRAPLLLESTMHFFRAVCLFSLYLSHEWTAQSNSLHKLHQDAWVSLRPSSCRHNTIYHLVFFKFCSCCWLPADSRQVSDRV